MKKTFFILALFVTMAGMAQTRGTATLYAYKQGVAGGMQKKIIEEETGKEVIEPSHQNFNYFIYLVSTNRIYPSHIWMNGQQFSVKVEKVSKTPVIIENTSEPMNPKKIVLVPKTWRKVIQLTPAPFIAGKDITKGKTLSTSHELVVVYKSNGKFYYQTQKKFTQLEPIALQ